MLLNQTGFALCFRVLNMVAYGCNSRNGFDDAAYSLFQCRMNGMLPEGETLPEFEPRADYPVLGGDDVDAAAWAAARRLTRTTERAALALEFRSAYDGKSDRELAA